MQGIYMIRCTKTNKVYIGQTTNFNQRKNSHICSLRKHSGIQKLQIDWDLYGENFFEFIFLEECQNKEERNNLEKKYIQTYDSIENGYNTNTGGIGQGNFNYLNGMYGHFHTDASKQLMSKNRKGKCCGVNNANFGKHLAETTKEKISRANKNRVQSKEEKDKRNATMSELRKSKEFQDKMKQAAKRAGLSNRKYSDDFVRLLREKHNDGMSIKKISLEYNVPFESCRLMINGDGRYAEIK